MLQRCLLLQPNFYETGLPPFKLQQSSGMCSASKTLKTPLYSAQSSLSLFCYVKANNQWRQKLGAGLS